MHKPRKTITSRVVHKNPYYQVRRDQYIRANGRKSTYFSVIADTFVVICPLDRKRGGVYIVKSWRYPLNCYLWEFPKGWRERSETPLMSAKRELLEETGMAARKWKRIGWLHMAPGITNQKGHVFMADHLEQRKNPKPNDEIVEQRFVTFLQLEKLIETGRFTDSSSVVAYHHLKNFLAE